MNAKVSFAFAGFACFALTGLMAGSVEDRLAALERRVAELEQRLGGAKESPTAQASLQDGVTDLREKVKLRYDKDVAEYGKSAMREIERLYRAFSKTGDAAAFDELLKRFPKACRTGCAVMYAGQRAKGDEAVKWFKKAIADHGDCYFEINDRSQGIKVLYDGRVLLRDTNDNRYEIENVGKLDRKSRDIFLL